MNREHRAQVADETLRILKKGQYTTPSGKTVVIDEMLKLCVEKTDCHEPGMLEKYSHALADKPQEMDTSVTLANETTLSAARRLTRTYPNCRVGILNFASAKHPGGGFRTGSHAQEESLARSSGLFSSLLAFDGYYCYHKGLKSCMYSDRMIYSPGCPVFRDDDNQLLEDPYCVDILTSPAPNAGAIRRNEPERVADIPTVLRTRMEKLLALFLHQRCEVVVLGAWGCGVFQNDPAMVAELFADCLNPGGLFYNRFVLAHFAVLDRHGSTCQAFEKALDVV